MIALVTLLFQINVHKRFATHVITAKKSSTNGHNGWHQEETKEYRRRDKSIGVRVGDYYSGYSGGSGDCFRGCTIRLGIRITLYSTATFQWTKTLHQPKPIQC